MLLHFPSRLVYKFKYENFRRITTDLKRYLDIKNVLEFHDKSRLLHVKLESVREAPSNYRQN